MYFTPLTCVCWLYSELLHSFMPLIIENQHNRMDLWLFYAPKSWKCINHLDVLLTESYFKSCLYFFVVLINAYVQNRINFLSYCETCAMTSNIVTGGVDLSSMINCCIMLICCLNSQFQHRKEFIVVCEIYRWHSRKQWYILIHCYSHSKSMLIRNISMF